MQAYRAHVNRWGPEVRQNKKPATSRGDFVLEYPLFRMGFQEPGRIPAVHWSGLSTRKPQNRPVAGQYPGEVANRGLAHFAAFLLEGDIPSRYEAVRMADWLLRNLHEWRGRFAAWIERRDFAFFRLKAPWISARTHGLAISLLLRIARVNNDAAYEDGAKRAIKLFFLPVEEGGLVRRLASGNLAFETFPAHPRAISLTGFLIGLIALTEYVQYFDDSDVQMIQKSGLSGLKESLSRYDTKKWILYDLHPSRRCASVNEMRTACILLKQLARMTEMPEFAHWAQKWIAYPEDRANRRYFLMRRMSEKIRLIAAAGKYGVSRTHLREAPR